MTALTIQSAAISLRAGELTSVELVGELLAASDTLDPELGTYIVRLDETALAAARTADEELAAGTDRGVLHGIPLGIKDILATDDAPTTCQSLVLPDTWGARGDGPVLQRLRAAGAVIMGKTTTMEFAVGRPDTSKPFPLPRNPWNPDRWTGGSSSGTANGVASGQFLGGLGTDTGGSVRLPSAYCGISGHKPTFGLVPKSGCFPLGYSYDHIGPMTRTAWDCAAMLSVMAGPHPSDRTTVPYDVPDYTAGLDEPVAGMRIGVITTPMLREATGGDVWAAFETSVEALRSAGAEVVETDVPLYTELHYGDFLGLQAEAFAYHRNWLAERWSDYGRPTRLTLALGALISGGDLAQIDRVREVGRQQITALMEGSDGGRGFDVLVSPSAGYAAQPFHGSDPKTRSMAAIHSPVWNAVGFPAISVPMGFDDDSMPVGLQVIGRPFDDATVLRVAHQYQQLTSWHDEIAPEHASTVT